MALTKPSFTKSLHVKHPGHDETDILGRCVWSGRPHRQFKTCLNWEPIYRWVPMTRKDWLMMFLIFGGVAAIFFIAAATLFTLLGGGGN